MSETGASKSRSKSFVDFKSSGKEDNSDCESISSVSSRKSSMSFSDIPRRRQTPAPQAETSSTPLLRKGASASTTSKVSSNDDKTSAKVKTHKDKSSTQTALDKRAEVNWKVRLVMLSVAIGFSASVAIYITSSLISAKNQQDTSLDVRVMKSELQSKVFGQSGALEEVISEIRNVRSDRLKVVLLVGGPGVGKDHTAQIATSEFHRQMGPACVEYTYLLLAHAKICVRPDMNFVTLETLKDVNDIDKAVKLIRLLVKNDVTGIVFVPILAAKAMQENQNEALEMLTTVEEYKKLVLSRAVIYRDLFDKQGVQNRMVVFNPITREVVKQCLGSGNEDVVNTVMMNREFALNGCKGLDMYE